MSWQSQGQLAAPTEDRFPVEWHVQTIPLLAFRLPP